MDFPIIFRVPSLDELARGDVPKIGEFLMNLGAGVSSLTPYTFSDPSLDLAVISLRDGPVGIVSAQAKVEDTRVPFAKIMPGGSPVPGPAGAGRQPNGVTRASPRKCESRGLDRRRRGFRDGQSCQPTGISLFIPGAMRPAGDRACARTPRCHGTPGASMFPSPPLGDRARPRHGVVHRTRPALLPARQHDGCERASQRDQ